MSRRKEPSIPNDILDQLLPATIVCGNCTYMT
ncbi:hypothetical protein IWY39_002794 [Sphingobium sp. JAI105]|nr:hypothetical protein [Sphingobium sp. JAI105]